MSESLLRLRLALFRLCLCPGHHFGSGLCDTRAVGVAQEAVIASAIETRTPVVGHALSRNAAVGHEFREIVGGPALLLEEQAVEHAIRDRPRRPSLVAPYIEL